MTTSAFTEHPLLARQDEPLIKFFELRGWRVKEVAYHKALSVGPSAFVVSLTLEPLTSSPTSSTNNSLTTA